MKKAKDPARGRITHERAYEQSLRYIYFFGSWNTGTILTVAVSVKMVPERRSQARAKVVIWVIGLDE